MFGSNLATLRTRAGSLAHERCVQGQTARTRTQCRRIRAAHARRRAPQDRRALQPQSVSTFVQNQQAVPPATCCEQGCGWRTRVLRQSVSRTLPKIFTKFGFILQREPHSIVHVFCVLQRVVWRGVERTCRHRKEQILRGFV